MTYDVRLVRVDATPLATVRRRASRGRLATVVPEACGMVWDVLRTRGLQGGRNAAVYWNDAIDLDVGVELTGPFSPEGEVRLTATPAGTAATVTHLGPYQGLGLAHEAIHHWSASHGHRLAGPRWEVYGHWQPAWNGDPSQIRTDVFYQLASLP